jgi:hypothetical protein
MVATRSEKLIEAGGNVRKFLIISLLFFGMNLTANMDQYNSLKNEISSQTYKLTKLSHNNFNLEGNVS